MSVEIKDNSKEYLEALKQAIRNGLLAIGLTAERHAKQDPTMPVDTGRARNSITFAIAGEEANTKIYQGDRGEEGGKYVGKADGEKGKEVFIGSNVEYFPYIELGSRTIKARHVLKRAATEHSAEYQDLMEQSLKNG